MSFGFGLSLPSYNWLTGSAGGLSLLDQAKAAIGSNEGFIIDVAAAVGRGAIWEDTARTIAASVDGPVGSIQDELQRYYMEQATTTVKPLLRSGYWLEFDGAGDSIAIADDPGLDFGTSDFTLAVSIKPDVITGGHGVLSKRGSGSAGTNPGWGLRQVYASIWLEYDYTGNASGPLFGVTSDVLSVGAWSDIVIQFDRGAATATAVANGVAQTPVSVGTTGDVTNTRPVVIGQDPTGAIPFDGTISRAFATNKLLTPGQLDAINAWLRESHP